MQLPLSHMNDLKIIFYIKVLLIWKNTRDKFSRCINLRKIQKWLIIRNLQDKSTISIGMINQNRGHFLIPQKMKHSLLALLLNHGGQFPTLKMNINNIKQLMFPLHPNTQPIPKSWMNSISYYYILTLTNCLVLMIN